MKIFRSLTLALCLATSAGFATFALADDGPPIVQPKPGSVQISLSGPVRTVTLIEMLLENGFFLIQAWLI